MILDEGTTPFHAMVELKQTAQPKNLLSQMQTRKESHQIVK